MSTSTANIRLSAIVPIDKRLKRIGWTAGPIVISVPTRHFPVGSREHSLDCRKATSAVKLDITCPSHQHDWREEAC